MACKIFVPLIAIIFITSCTNAQDTAPSSAVEEYYDITYYSGEDADTEKHKLNLFLPDAKETFPMMLWIHGGAWAVGGRENETDLARNFAKQGIGVAAISYRLSPGLWLSPKLDKGIQHPEHIRDVARAFKWLYDHAKEYGYDQKGIVVSGFSAGGHLSALLALDGTYLKEVGHNTTDLYACIPIAGGYDLVDYYNSQLKEGGQEHADLHVRAALGDTMEDLRKASPSEYVENSRIPMLVVSETDTYDYTYIFEKLVREKEIKNIEFLHVKDLDHKGLFFDLAGNKESSYLKQIAAFANKL